MLSTLKAVGKIRVVFILVGLMGCATALSPEKLAEVRVLEAESMARLSAEGEILFSADTIKLTGFQYCSNAVRLFEDGNLRLGIREASKALFLGQRSGDQYLLAIAKRDLAYGYSLAGHLSRAAQFAEEALEHMKYARPGVDQLAVLGPVRKIRGDVKLRQKQFSDAIRDYSEALSASRESFKPFVQVSLANAYLANGDTLQARRLLQEVEPRATAGLRLLVHRGLAEVALSQGHFPEAIKLFTEAATRLSAPDQTYHRLWAFDGLARARGAAGDRRGSIEAYTQAIETAEKVRALFRSDEFKAGFFGDIQQIFDGAVQLLVEDGQTERAIETSERSRSRALLDLLRERVPQSAGSVAFADPLGKVIAASELQRALPENVAIAEYHVLQHRLVGWVIRRSGVTSVAIGLDRQNLARTVLKFREAIRTLGPQAGQIGSELYAQLVAPLELKGSEALIVIPHDALHYLPFQALRGPQGYLIEERAIAYVPSLSVLMGQLKGKSEETKQVLALGNPDLGSPLMALPGAEIEVNQIRSYYDNAEIYIGKEATKERFLQRAPQSNLVHIAAHAEIDEVDPLFSIIRLARTEKISGSLEAHEVYRTDLRRANLVTLSACDSGLGQVSRGDEIWGFTRAFLSAGASSLMVSLWQVDDESTATLMANFYKNLKTMTKVEALRQAQLNLIRGNIRSDLLARRGIGGIGKLGETPSPALPVESSQLQAAGSVSTSHPYFWAPFILVGDGK